MTYLDAQMERLPVAAAGERVLALAAVVGEPAWTIVQSYTGIAFQNWSGASGFPLEFASIYNGRIFGVDAEVCWIREGPEVSIWILREGDAGQPCMKLETPYYLWGVFRDGRFSEDIVPRLLEYPEVEGKNRLTGDRPYIDVIEYMPAEPEDEGTELTPETLTAELNGPRVFAHRFAGYSCGRTKEKGKSHAA